MAVDAALVDAALGWLIRRFSRRILDFSEAPSGAQLPDPAPGRLYMLYLHVPYCTVLCPFCSFHRVQFKHGAATRYFECLRREIEIVADRGYRHDEVYFGGGTPTVLPEEIFATIELLRGLHPLGEISIETNPDHLGKDAMGRLLDAGINRLSVGVQSFDDGLLREMERFDKYGSGADIRRRLRRVHGTFDTLNVDMIFNLPHQTEAMLRRDLDILVDEIGAEQVSFYPLMTAGGTREAMREAMGDVSYANERRYYEIIAGRMLDAGYSRSSSWCFSRKQGMADEYIVDRDEYVGLGSGAFSYLGGMLYASTFSLGQYRRLIGEGKTGMVFRQAMSDREQMRYYLLMLLFGGSLDLAIAEEQFGGRFRRRLWAELMALQTIGAVKEREGRLTLTERGHYLWVMIMREFFSGVNRLREEMRQRVKDRRAMAQAA